MVAAQLATLLLGREELALDHWVGDLHATSGRRSSRSSALKNIIFMGSRYISRKSGYSDFFCINNIPFFSASKDYDIFHCHDLSGIMSPNYIKTLSNRAPVIWTFHDSSSFTGGCIYPVDCPTYESGCGNCPQLSRWPLLTSFDRTISMRKWRRSIVNNFVSAVVCPSVWIAKEAEKSGIHPNLIRVIPNSVDINVFQPLKKNAVRAEIGLPSNAFIAFLGCASFSNSYKGIEQAFKAISSFGSNLHVFMVGNNPPSNNLPPGPIYHYRDFTSDRYQLAKYYAACDVSLLPSLADNFPLMLLETMACGTPPIAFATGGIPEAIEHDENGWLSTPRDVPGLVSGLHRAMDSELIRRKWAENACATVSARFTKDKFLRAHIALYERVFAERQSGGVISSSTLE